MTNRTSPCSVTFFDFDTRYFPYGIQLSGRQAWPVFPFYGSPFDIIASIIALLTFGT